MQIKTDCIQTQDRMDLIFTIHPSKAEKKVKQKPNVKHKATEKDSENTSVFASSVISQSLITLGLQEYALANPLKSLN